MATFFCLVLASCSIFWSIYIRSFVPCVLLWHHFFLLEKVYSMWANYRFFSLICISLVNRLLVYSCRGWFFLGSFWIRVVFSFIIHSGMLASLRHLPCYSTSLSWMEINFLKLESMFTLLARILQSSTFLGVTLRESRFIFTSGPSSNSFFLLFARLAFLFFWFPYFIAKLFCFFCIHLLGPHHQLFGRIFFCYCCGPVKGSEERHNLGITWNKYIERKYKNSIGKRVLNISLTAKVLGWS